MRLRGERASSKTLEGIAVGKESQPGQTLKGIETDSRRGNVLRHWGSPNGAADMGETCGGL